MAWVLDICQKVTLTQKSLLIGSMSQTVTRFISYNHFIPLYTLPVGMKMHTIPSYPSPKACDLGFLSHNLAYFPSTRILPATTPQILQPIS